jgi:hypothetical protein
MVLFSPITSTDFPDLTLNEADVAAFTDRYCSSCHNDVDKEGGLDLTTMAYSPTDPANFLTWVKVHDRVSSGEMPPKEKKRPDRNELTNFVGGLSASLTKAETETLARDGRAMRRRLNRSEYEFALRDLLDGREIAVRDG